MSAPENPAAFPGPGPRIGTDETHGFGIFADAVPGMTLRDWFAGQALAAIVAPNVDHSVFARKAYLLADAMLAERAKSGDQ